MNEQEIWNLKRAQLKDEINDEPFFGPYIVSNGKSGFVSDKVEHTGYSIQVVTADRKIDAAILKINDWFFFRPSQLVISRDEIGFPFFHFRGDTVPLFDLLDSLVALRERPMDAQEILVQISPMTEAIMRAPLKRNCMDCMIAKYREQGFAVAPVKLSGGAAVLRVVWLLPCERQNPPWSHYFPVGTIKIPFSADGAFSVGTFEIPDWNRFFRHLARAMEPEHVRNPIQMLSEDGRREIETAIRSRADGGHPRTKRHQTRVEIVRARPDLWDQPLVLALLLRDAGLYSSKVNKAELKSQVERLIFTIRNSG